MIIRCKCGKKLTTTLETEIYIKSFDSEESPNTNEGQYAEKSSWVEKEFGGIDKDESYRLNAANNHESYLKKDEFFFVPKRTPKVDQEHHYNDENDNWVVEISAGKENLQCEYTVLKPSGILEYNERNSLPKGIVVPKDSVLSGVIPDWPAEERMKTEGREWLEGSAAGGCCNWANLQLECECGNVLGLLEIDCWQFKLITLYRENTELVEA